MSSPCGHCMCAGAIGKHEHCSGCSDMAATVCSVLAKHLPPLRLGALASDALRSAMRIRTSCASLPHQLARCNKVRSVFEAAADLANETTSTRGTTRFSALSRQEWAEANLGVRSVRHRHGWSSHLGRGHPKPLVKACQRAQADLGCLRPRMLLLS